MCLGTAFTHFFTVYGDQNLFNDTVIINNSLFFELATSNNSCMTGALVVLDPVDSSNNVGKQIYNFFTTVQD